ncbi:MAG: hypothetical protein P4L87_11150 [Formivibrio sp.]|nr:hypothetical protein [Formivibrio sp.]
MINLLLTLEITELIEINKTLTNLTHPQSTAALTNRSSHVRYMETIGGFIMTSVSATSSSNNIWQSIGQGIQNGANAIKEDASEAGDAVVSAFSSMENSVESGISAIGDAVKSGVSAVKDEWETLGQSIDIFG